MIQQSSSNVSASNMNCSASISGQSSYSNITNHSDQCNQDVGVPIIVERSSDIRNSSSGKVIERVEGQVLKNNNCVKTIDDKLRNENKRSSVRTGYSDKSIIGESNDEDIYYDVLTQQRALFDASSTNGLLRIGGSKQYDTVSRDKHLPPFYSPTDRQLLTTDGKHSSPIVFPSEDHIDLESDEIHVDAGRMDNNLKPASCVPLIDAKITSITGTRDNQNSSQYSLTPELLPSKYTNHKIYESMETNEGIGFLSGKHNSYNKLNDSQFNPLAHEASARVTHSKTDLPSSNSPPELINRMSCPEEHGLSSSHLASNGPQEQKIESNVQAYPESPSNDFHPKIPLNGNETRLCVGTKEKEYNYSLYQGSVELKRVDDRNSRSIESGKIR